MFINLYLRSRRIIAAGIIVTVLTIISLASGPRMLTLFTGEHGVAFPYRWVLSLFTASICVASTASPVPELDTRDTGVLRKTRNFHLLFAGLVAIVSAVISSIGESPDTLLAVTRGMLTWYVLAVLGARLFTPANCWVFPLAGLGVLIWYGYFDGSPAAWNWVLASTNRLSSWGVFIIVAAIDVVIQWWPADYRRSLWFIH